MGLFADWGRSADAQFTLTGETTRAVARLDGMPLAIELAAARVEALGVTQLLDRIDDRFALLASGDRTAPSRQRSLAALAMAREIGYPAGETNALGALTAATGSSGDLRRRSAAGTAGRTDHRRRARRVRPVVQPLLDRRADRSRDLAGAGEVCAAGLAQSRDADDVVNQWSLLPHMVLLDVHASRLGDAAAHLREELQLAVRTGGWAALLNSLDACGFLCAAAGRPAEAVTMWAANDALTRQTGLSMTSNGRACGTSPYAPPRQALEPGQAGAAEERGAAMSLAAAAEYALMLAEDPAHHRR